jgi:cell wall-associated NlpC family hydrolase
MTDLSHAASRYSDLAQQQRDAVLIEATSWIGTPYHHEAFVKGAGVDCAFFLICCYHAAGVIPWIDPRPYPRDWHFHRDAERYLGWVERYCDQVEVPEPGDLVVFQYGRTFSHGAIVVKWPLMLHSYVNLGVGYADGERGEFAVTRDDRQRRKLFYSPWRVVQPSTKGEAT